MPRPGGRATFGTQPGSYVYSRGGSTGKERHLSSVLTALPASCWVPRQLGALGTFLCQLGPGQLEGLSQQAGGDFQPWGLQTHGRDSSASATGSCSRQQNPPCPRKGTEVLSRPPVPRGRSF